jgi:hypothetical protein
MTFGFLASGAPLILRARGIQLAEVGLLQLINLPVGLTFVWAYAVDRIRLPFLSPCLAWVAAAQGAAVALLTVLSFGEDWGLVTLLAIAVATACCTATMDIALEAFVVETMAADQRPYVTSAKLFGGSLGSIVGAGLLIAYYDALGWQTALLAIAGLNLFCLLPILCRPEARPGRWGANRLERGPTHTERLHALAARVVVLGFYFAAMFALTGVDNLVLLDLGVPLGQVGFVTGSLSPVVNLAMVLLSGWLIREVGTVRLITVSAAGVLAGGALMLAACAIGSAVLGLVATILSYVSAGGLGVPVFNVIYRWAQGPRPATDYALLFGAAYFAAMPLRVATPALAGQIGWPAYFVIALPFYGIAVGLLCQAISRTPGVDRSAGIA